MIPLLLIFIHEDERQKKLDDPDYASPYDIDLTEVSGWDVLLGVLFGLSPFILAGIAILVTRWTT